MTPQTPYSQLCPCRAKNISQGKSGYPCDVRYGVVTVRAAYVRAVRFIFGQFDRHIENLWRPWLTKFHSGTLQTAVGVLRSPDRFLFWPVKEVHNFFFSLRTVTHLSRIRHIRSFDAGAWYAGISLKRKDCLWFSR